MIASLLRKCFFILTVFGIVVLVTYCNDSGSVDPPQTITTTTLISDNGSTESLKLPEISEIPTNAEDIQRVFHDENSGYPRLPRYT